MAGFRRIGQDEWRFRLFLRRNRLPFGMLLVRVMCFRQGGSVLGPDADRGILYFLLPLAGLGAMEADGAFRRRIR